MQTLGMKRTFGLALLAFVALGWGGCAMAAQDAAAEASPQQSNVATVTVDGGVIMLSKEKAPFRTAVDDDPVVKGERMMVTKESQATLVYNAGCKRTYSDPGVYVVPGTCKAAAALVPNHTSVWPIIGAGVLGAAVGTQICDCHCPPVSR